MCPAGDNASVDRQHLSSDEMRERGRQEHCSERYGPLILAGPMESWRRSLARSRTHRDGPLALYQARRNAVHVDSTRTELHLNLDQLEDGQGHIHVFRGQEIRLASTAESPEGAGNETTRRALAGFSSRSVASWNEGMPSNQAHNAAPPPNRQSSPLPAFLIDSHRVRERSLFMQTNASMAPVAHQAGKVGDAAIQSAARGSTDALRRCQRCQKLTLD
jgi:hypothetical protein